MRSRLETKYWQLIGLLSNENVFPTETANQVLDKLAPQITEVGLYIRGRISGLSYPLPTLDSDFGQAIALLSPIADSVPVHRRKVRTYNNSKRIRQSPEDILLVKYRKLTKLLQEDTPQVADITRRLETRLVEVGNYFRGGISALSFDVSQLNQEFENAINSLAPSTHKKVKGVLKKGSKQ